MGGTKALTIGELQEILPKGMSKQINPLLVMRVNNVLTNPEEFEFYKENLLTYVSVLQKGRFQLAQYLNAVRYVSFKVMGCTNKEAYRRTFTKKYNDFKARGVAEKDIASYTTAYNKSKLVNLIFEQTLIPVHILNAPVLQQAINTQASIMLDTEVSAKVRSDAANSLMTHLKAPEERKVELDIGLKDGGLLKELKDITLGLAIRQKQNIDNGLSTPLQIAQQAIITVEANDE